MEILVDRYLFNIRIDNFLVKKLFIPYSLVQGLIRKGKIKIGRSKLKANYIVKEGDVITLYYNIEQEKEERKQDFIDKGLVTKFFKNNTLLDTDSFIIIKKPHGIPSQGGVDIKNSIDKIAKTYDENWRIVHRLDKETSGIMVIAKTQLDAQELSKLIRERRIQKYYIGIVHGRLTEKQKIETVQKKEGYIFQTYDNGIIPDSQIAITELYPIILEKNPIDKTIVIFKIITGRTHQIRSQMSFLQHPLLGDTKYGIRDGFSRLSLHHVEVRFFLKDQSYKCRSMPDFLEKIFDMESIPYIIDKINKSLDKI